MTDRERALHQACQVLTMSHDAVCDIADALLEAKAQGVEWAAKERCTCCQTGSKSRNATHNLGQEPSKWLNGRRWIDCDAWLEVERAAELRAQKGGGR